MRQNALGSSPFEASDEPAASDDLLGAATRVARGDRKELTAALDRLKQRVRQRAQDVIDARATAVQGTAVGPRMPASGPPGPLVATPVPAPAGPVRLGLRNGRTLRVRMSPAPARRQDLAALAQVTDANQRRLFGAIDRQRRAHDGLARSHRGLATKVAQMQEENDAALGAMLKELGRLRTFATAAATAATAQATTIVTERRTAAVTARRQRALARERATVAQIDKLNTIVGSMQTAAFGEKGKLLSTNNLLLGANQALWSYADPILKAFGLAGGPGPSLAAYLAPLGSLATGQLALGGRQHVRFLSGITAVPLNLSTGIGLATVPLQPLVAASFFPTLAARTDVPATAAGINAPLGATVRAIVARGSLILEVLDIGDTPIAVTGGFTEVRVAWMVDTGVDGG